MTAAIDTDRHPTARHGPSRQAMAAPDRAEPGRRGMVGLGGFLPDAARPVAGLAPRFDAGCFTHRRHDSHFREDVTDLPPCHPALTWGEAVSLAPGADQVTEQMTGLSDRSPFAAFPAEMMGLPALRVTMEDRAGVMAAFPFHDRPGVVLPRGERIAYCQRAA